MKNLRKLILLPLTFLLSACSIGFYDIVETQHRKEHYYGTLHFNTRGGEEIRSMTFIQGKEFDITKIIPHKEGCEFYGWSETDSVLLNIKKDHKFYGDEVTVYANYYDDFDSCYFITGGYIQDVVSDKMMVAALAKRVGKYSGRKVYDYDTQTYYQYARKGNDEYFYIYEPMVFQNNVIDKDKGYYQLIATGAWLSASLQVIDTSVKGYLSTYAYKCLNETFFSNHYFSDDVLSKLATIATFPTGEELIEAKSYNNISKALEFNAKNNSDINTHYFMLRDRSSGSLCKVYDNSKNEIVDYGSGYSSPVIVPVLYSKNYQSILEEEIENEKNALVVTFNTDGGTEIPSVELEKDNDGYGTLHLNTIPSAIKEDTDENGYDNAFTFLGWSFEKDGAIITDASIRINESTTLYAIYDVQKTLKSHKVYIGYKYSGRNFPTGIAGKTLDLYVNDDPIYLYHRPVEGILEGYVVASWFTGDDSNFTEPLHVIKNVTKDTNYYGRLVSTTSSNLRYITLHEGDATYKIYFLTGDKHFSLPDCVNADEKWVDDNTNEIYNGKIDLNTNHSYTARKVKEHTITFDKARSDVTINYDSKTIYYIDLPGKTYADQIEQLPTLVIADKTVAFIKWTYENGNTFSLTDVVLDEDIVLTANYQSSATEYGTYITLNMDAIQGLNAVQSGELPPSFLMMLPSEDNVYAISCFFIVGSDFYIFYDENDEPAYNIVHPAGIMTKTYIVLTLKKFA